MLVFLKLGGSLITDKSQASTHRPDVLARLSEEISSALHENTDLKLLIGHGSGSFGHMAAASYQTHLGVHTDSEWSGFAEVWYAAHRLNVLVVDALRQSGLPVIAFPPSSAVISLDGRVKSYALEPLQAALASGLVPVINGDVIFDRLRGGTILSTESLFAYLAGHLKPDRILLAGHEPGVWSDFPHKQSITPVITGTGGPVVASGLHGSAATDVTGGMHDKVQSMLTLVNTISGVEILIFSGEKGGLVREALLGASPGTLIRSPRG
jgi:isopentenyl phosphate kinase